MAHLQPNFLVKFWNVTTRVFILRVGRENLDTAVNSLVLMSEVLEYEKMTTGTGMPCRVRILHVGGTLDKVEHKYKMLSEAWLQSNEKKLEN